uniref:Uncharacterized protein n=1 Tax=Cucumis melo TaxID=3656 RepID=A0A9I9CUW9_CUCME
MIEDGRQRLATTTKRRSVRRSTERHSTMQHLARRINIRRKPAQPHLGETTTKTQQTHEIEENLG